MSDGVINESSEAPAALAPSTVPAAPAGTQYELPGSLVHDLALTTDSATMDEDDALALITVLLEATGGWPLAGRPYQYDPVVIEQHFAANYPTASVLKEEVLERLRWMKLIERVAQTIPTHTPRATVKTYVRLRRAFITLITGVYNIETTYVMPHAGAIRTRFNLSG